MFQTYWTGLSLLGWKMLKIIGDYYTAWNTLRTVDGPLLRHESLSFTQVFKPCQLQHSTDFQAQVDAKELNFVNSWERNWMCIIILDALSPKVLIQENKREKITHCPRLNYFVVLTKKYFYLN